MRNTHFKASLLAPGGPKCLHLWCSLWAAGQITPTIARVFNTGHVVPLAKGATIDMGIRPIALFERILKLATGATLDTQQIKLQSTLAPDQFGVSTPAGAEQMVYNTRALSKLHPDFVFTATDVKNAFWKP